MTNSYSNPLTYGQPVQAYDTQAKKQSSAPYGIAGLAVGGAAGALVGYKKNPFIAKNGEATDVFAKNVYEKYAEKAKDSIKKPYEQTKEILKNLDSVKTLEELKTLFSKNKEVADSLEITVDNVNTNNLAETKKTIKENLEAKNKTRFQDMKNKIKTFWDAEKKKFFKPEGSDESIFNAINDAKKGVKGKLIAKYTAIGAIGLGIITTILHKLITSKKPTEDTQQIV